MEKQDYAILLAAFILSTGAGFTLGQILDPGNGYVKEVNVTVNADKETAELDFNGHTLELRYEDSPKAEMYYAFNDSRGVTRIEGLEHDSQLNTFRDIKSFGNQTYFLYFRYMDDPKKREDGFLKLYRIEET
ncbi:MAG: hypothetical protein ABEJ95_03600 [Candidatus Nanohalobium sp.]